MRCACVPPSPVRAGVRRRAVFTPFSTSPPLGCSELQASPAIGAWRMDDDRRPWGHAGQRRSSLQYLYRYPSSSMGEDVRGDDGVRTSLVYHPGVSACYRAGVQLCRSLAAWCIHWRWLAGLWNIIACHFLVEWPFRPCPCAPVSRLLAGNGQSGGRAQRTEHSHVINTGAWLT